MNYLLERVRIKATGRECMVKRDFIREDGSRQLSLRPLDEGTLLFVKPDDVELVGTAQLTLDMGRTAGKASNEGEKQTEGDA